MPFSAASSSFLSGKYATAAIGGAPGSGSASGSAAFEFGCVSWSVNPTIMIVEFVNSLTGGHVLREGTFWDVTGTIDAEFDFGNELWADYPTLPIPGSNLTNLYLYVRQTAKSQYNGVFWTFSSVIVTAAPMQVAVTGKPTYRIPFAGNGTISPPGGTTY